MKSIDINCDMGESFGNYRIGNDQAIFPYITSSNIACGFHAGDHVQMERTIRMAVKHGVRIGAHPGFPDLAGFGRRKIDLSTEELRTAIKYQLAAIIGMSASLDAKVQYVKPHGALYNMAADDESIASTVIQAVIEIDKGLSIMGLAGSRFMEVCRARNLSFIPEAFADRGYNSDGRLLDRTAHGSVLTDPATISQQVLDMVLNHQVTAEDGSKITLVAETVCVHGDNPQAVPILQEIDTVLKTHGIQKSY